LNVTSWIKSVVLIQESAEGRRATRIRIAAAVAAGGLVVLWRAVEADPSWFGVWLVLLPTALVCLPAGLFRLCTLLGIGLALCIAAFGWDAETALTGLLVSVGALVEDLSNLATRNDASQGGAV
jgi:hypothetical protein